ncbi:hypothetical protein ACE6H2_025886 [Prunus campanulata]
MLTNTFLFSKFSMFLTTSLFSSKSSKFSKHFLHQILKVLKHILFRNSKSSQTLSLLPQILSLMFS